MSQILTSSIFPKKSAPRNSIGFWTGIFPLKSLLLFTSKPFTNNLKVLGAEDYINAYLITKNIRPAYLIQQLEYSDEEIEIRDLALGVWEADDEDDMIDEITTATGYLIKNIYYDIQLK